MSNKKVHKIGPGSLLDQFLASRRQGTSPRTLQFYRGYLTRAITVVGLSVKAKQIISFLHRLSCSNGGRHAYYRSLRAFYNWLYSLRSGLGLNPQDNPMLLIDPPKVEKRILPSSTPQQVQHLMREAPRVRDRAIISLFYESGVRLSELSCIEDSNIDWEDYTVTVWGKGNKQRRAPFTERTAQLLRQIISQNGTAGNIWGLKARGIASMLNRLEKKTGVKCNAHTFRRAFASNLHREGMDIEHIMRLGGWENLQMVIRYTQSVKFEDSLRHYQATMKHLRDG